MVSTCLSCLKQYSVSLATSFVTQFITILCLQVVHVYVYYIASQTTTVLYIVKNNYSIWSKKGDHSVKRVKSYWKWSENLLLQVKVYSISSNMLLFLQSDSLFYSIFFTVYKIVRYKNLSDRCSPLKIKQFQLFLWGSGWCGGKLQLDAKKSNFESPLSSLRNSLNIPLHFKI